MEHVIVLDATVPCLGYLAVGNVYSKGWMT